LSSSLYSSSEEEVLLYVVLSDDRDELDEVRLMTERE